MNTTYSSRALLAVRRERELVERSIILYRRLRNGTGCECAELFTHVKNRETIAVIKGLVSAYAALKDAAETPSEFFTTKILLRISMQIMVILQARTRDPIAIFKRIYDREVAAQTHLKEKDPYIIYAARVDAHFGFPIATLLCPALNYARYLLKGGVIRRAIAKSIISAHLDATIHDEHERTRKRIEETNGLVQKVLSAITSNRHQTTDIKTIHALFHLTTQPRQKFKLALSVGHPVPKHQPTCNRTHNRRTDISRHKTAEPYHSNPTTSARHF